MWTDHATQLLAVVAFLVLLQLILGDADLATPITGQVRRSGLCVCLQVLHQLLTAVQRLAVGSRK